MFCGVFNIVDALIEILPIFQNPIEAVRSLGTNMAAIYNSNTKIFML